MRRRHELTVAQWAKIEPLVAGREGDRGRTGANKAYHSHDRVISLWLRGVEPLLPRRGGPDTHAFGQGLGRVRWVVERTIAWLHQFRRLRVRYERRADIHQAFLSLGCILICFRTLDPLFC